MSAGPNNPSTENPNTNIGSMEDDIEPQPVHETDVTSAAVESKSVDEGEDIDAGEPIDEGEQIEPGERGLKESSARSTPRSTPPDRLSDAATTSGH